MKQLKQQFVDSWHELRKTKVMAVAAMLIAIGVILGFFSVQLTEFIRIGFSGIPNELASMLFGPVVGGIMGGIGDILKFLIKPTGPYFFGYTLNAMLLFTEFFSIIVRFNWEESWQPKLRLLYL